MSVWRSLFLHRHFYWCLGAIVILFFLGAFWNFIFISAFVALGSFAIILAREALWLYNSPGSVTAKRIAGRRLSNGDMNHIRLEVTNKLQRSMRFRVLDELPPQFQRRDLDWKFELRAGQMTTLAYHVRPVERGEYHFGAIRIFVRSSPGLLLRRYTIAADEIIKVYPSYLQLRRYGFLAIDKRLQQTGLKKVRRLGHTMEFEQIREYVKGDDTRVINWKATARTGKPMVNQFQDERAQPVYCIIDKGRLMQMPFEGMSLLDYSINAALVLSYVAINKSDKAGLVTFAQSLDDIVPAGRRSHQMNRIMETLYRQTTDFLEADFERLVGVLSRKVRQRSLMIVMTNFESVIGLRRQLPYLCKMSERHVVIVVFFQNTSLLELTTRRASSLREIYHQTLAEKIQFEKETMVRILRNHGIYAVLTTPGELTVDTINQYLALKARGVV